MITEERIVTGTAQRIMLVPVSESDGTPEHVVDGYGVRDAPRDDGQASLILTILGNVDLGSVRLRDRPIEFSHLRLDRNTYCRGLKYTPRERRHEARRTGRRRSVPVPISSLWMVVVFAPAGIDDHIVERATRDRMTLVEKVWRRGIALDWARRSLARNMRLAKRMVR